MKRFLAKLDEFASDTDAQGAARWLDRLAFVFLMLMVISAPHSIAATQTAWLAGMLFFIARLFFKPRPSLRTGWLGVALIVLFAWTVLTSFLSYAPDISINKLKQAGLFLIVFFVIGVIRSFKAAYFLVFALIASCLFNVLLMPIQRIIGRGVEIQTLRSDGGLAKAGFQSGDVLLSVDGKRIGAPADVANALRENEQVQIRYQNLEFYYERIVVRADAATEEIEDGTLGISTWKRSRSWRSAGFYGHYTTYAEMLQLIGSLVFGLFVAAFLSNNKAASVSTFTRTPAVLRSSRFRFLYTGVFAVFCFAAFCLALLLTVTRAPQLAFLISCFFVLLFGASRKWLIAALLVALPVAALGLFVLQRSRDVGFVDPNDAGQNWRMMVWREGLTLWTRTPRNFVVGVGMDSIKRYACDWGLYDNCRSEFRSHFHSTPIQLAVERGLPGLLLWLSVLAIYARTLWRSVRGETGDEPVWLAGSLLPDFSTTLNRGIWLGALGGLIGFFASSLVHYNYGDGEVVMVLYLIMGLSTKLSLLGKSQTA